MINIIIADDHRIVIDGIVSLLQNEEKIVIKGVADNGEDALALIEKEKIDIAILDINMPKMDGIQVAKAIQENKLDTKVLILSMYNDLEFLDPLLEAGCAGYILKNKGREELVKAILQIHSGKSYFGKAITDRIIEDRKKVKAKTTEIDPKLTKREVEVIKLIAREFTSKEIGAKLGISETTANTHRRNLISKLGVRNAVGLANYASKKGLLED